MRIQTFGLSFVCETDRKAKFIGEKWTHYDYDYSNELVIGKDDAMCGIQAYGHARYLARTLLTFACIKDLFI